MAPSVIVLIRVPRPLELDLRSALISGLLSASAVHNLNSVLLASWQASEVARRSAGPHVPTSVVGNVTLMSSS